MNPLFLLELAVQALLIVHVVKTGRSYIWMAAIGFLPGIGSLAYLVVEVLPDLFRGRTGRRMRRMIDPNQELRRASTEVEVSGNVDARRRLAEEQYQRGQFDAAIDTYQGGLRGIFEHDPALLLGLAQAQFARQDSAAARATLERMMAHNPEFKSTEAQLLYARSLEAQGALDAAERQYAATASGYPGAEARLRYGLLLKRLGKVTEARSVFKDLLDGARLSPAHYRKAQSEWLDRARKELG